MRWMVDSRWLGATLALVAALHGAGQDEDRTSYGPTGPSDTLWSIAQSVRPAGATMEQTMLALVRLNPDAFVGPMDKLVRAGVTLRAPLGEEAQAIGVDRAHRIVAGDEGPWKAAMAAIAPVPAGEPPSSARAPPPGAPSAQPDASAPAIGAAPTSPRGDEAEAMQRRLDGALADAAEARALLEARDAELADAKAEHAAARRELRRLERASPLAAFAESPMLLGGVGAAALAVLLLGFLMGRAGRPSPAPREAKPAPVALPPKTPAVQAPETQARSAREAGDKPDDPLPNVSADPSVPAARAEDAVPGAAAEVPEVAGGENAPAYGVRTKLNMARAYARLGDEESARGVCAEVVAEGSESEREAAQALLDELDARRE